MGLSFFNLFIKLFSFRHQHWSPAFWGLHHQFLKATGTHSTDMTLALVSLGFETDFIHPNTSWFCLFVLVPTNLSSHELWAHSGSIQITNLGFLANQKTDFAVLKLVQKRWFLWLTSISTLSCHYCQRFAFRVCLFLKRLIYPECRSLTDSLTERLFFSGRAVKNKNKKAPFARKWSIKMLHLIRDKSRAGYCGNRHTLLPHLL